MARKSANDRRAKLLVCIIKKGNEQALTDACNECCPTLSFTGIGYGTAKSHYMSYLGLDEVEKRVVYSLIPNYCEGTVLRVRTGMFCKFGSVDERRPVAVKAWRNSLCTRPSALAARKSPCV